GCFLPPLRAKAGLLAITTGSGRTRLLDAATGQFLHEADTPEAGPYSTLLAEGHGLCVPTDARHVGRIEPAAGKAIWHWTAPWATILTGQAPRLFGTSEALLVAWPTNLGAQVQRLDWETGKPRWSVLLPLDVEPSETAPWLLDEARFYFFRGDTLHAWSLDS